MSKAEKSAQAEYVHLCPTPLDWSLLCPSCGIVSMGMCADCVTLKEGYAHTKTRLKREKAR